MPNNTGKVLPAVLYRLSLSWRQLKATQASLSDSQYQHVRQRFIPKHSHPYVTSPQFIHGSDKQQVN